MRRKKRYSKEVLLELHYTSGRSVRVIAIDPVTGIEVTMVGDARRGEKAWKRRTTQKLRDVLNKKR